MFSRKLLFFTSTDTTWFLWLLAGQTVSICINLCPSPRPLLVTPEHTRLPWAVQTHDNDNFVTHCTMPTLSSSIPPHLTFLPGLIFCSHWVLSLTHQEISVPLLIMWMVLFIEFLVHLAFITANSYPIPARCLPSYSCKITRKLMLRDMTITLSGGAARMWCSLGPLSPQCKAFIFPLTQAVPISSPVHTSQPRPCSPSFRTHVPSAQHTALPSFLWAFSVSRVNITFYT